MNVNCRAIQYMFSIQNLLILLTIIILLIFVTYILCKSVLSSGKVLINDKQKQKLTNALLNIHNIFEKHNIWYVIAFGTLLGAVRHRGLIPWDDDIDLLINHHDISKILSLEHEFSKVGLRVEKTWKLIRLYIQDENNLFIDLFVIDVVNDKIVRCETDTNMCKYPLRVTPPKGGYPDIKDDWWHKWFNFNKDILQERKYFEYENIKVYGPVNPAKILSFWYGNNFLTECKTNYLINHGDTVTTPKIIKCANTAEIPQL